MNDLISREEAIKELKESAEHHEENSREYQLMLRDRNIIRGLPTVPAIPISVIDKLKSKMKERDADNGGEPLNGIDKGYHLAVEHLCKEIDSILKEYTE